MEDDLNITEALKSRVRWEMSWASHVLKDGTPMYPDLPPVEMMFEDNIALAILLIEGVIFLNNHWWMKDKGWSEEACRTTSLNVNVNDVFAWACADAETITHKDIKDLYTHWERDSNFGPAVWVCKRRGLMPQKPVAEAIRSAGIWDIDNMNLKENI